MALAKGLIESHLVNNVLLIVGDTPSKAVNMRDRGALALFSDGASATFINGVESEEELVGPFLFGTDGRGAKNLIMPAGAFRMRSCPETRIEKDDGTGNIRSMEDLFMDGAEIFNFSLQTVPKSVNQLMKDIGINDG